MTVTPEQSDAIQDVDGVIAKVVKLGDCPDGREIVRLLEQVKTKLVFGKFPNKGESND